MTTNKRPRGRPSKSAQDRPFQMRVSESFLRMVDDWRRGQIDVPSRAEAIRRMVEIAVKEKKKLNTDRWTWSRASKRSIRRSVARSVKNWEDIDRTIDFFLGRWNAAAARVDETSQLSRSGRSRRPHLFCETNPIFSAAKKAGAWSRSFPDEAPLSKLPSLKKLYLLARAW